MKKSILMFLTIVIVSVFIVAYAEQTNVTVKPVVVKVIFKYSDPGNNYTLGGESILSADKSGWQVLLTQDRNSSNRMIVLGKPEQISPTGVTIHLLILNTGWKPEVLSEQSLNLPYKQIRIIKLTKNTIRANISFFAEEDES